jgi:hypothetical protein
MKIIIVQELQFCEGIENVIQVTHQNSSVVKALLKEYHHAKIFMSNTVFSIESNIGMNNLVKKGKIGDYLLLYKNGDIKIESVEEFNVKLKKSKSLLQSILG